MGWGWVSPINSDSRTRPASGKLLTVTRLLLRIDTNLFLWWPLWERFGSIWWLPNDYHWRRIHLSIIWPVFYPSWKWLFLKISPTDFVLLFLKILECVVWVTPNSEWEYVYGLGSRLIWSFPIGETPPEVDVGGRRGAHWRAGGSRSTWYLEHLGWAHHTASRLGHRHLSARKFTPCCPAFQCWSGKGLKSFVRLAVDALSVGNCECNITWSVAQTWLESASKLCDSQPLSDRIFVETNRPNWPIPKMWKYPSVLRCRKQENRKSIRGRSSPPMFDAQKQKLLRRYDFHWCHKVLCIGGKNGLTVIIFYVSSQLWFF